MYAGTVSSRMLVTNVLAGGISKCGKACLDSTVYDRPLWQQATALNTKGGTPDTTSNCIAQVLDLPCINMQSILSPSRASKSSLSIPGHSRNCHISPLQTFTNFASPPMKNPGIYRRHLETSHHLWITRILGDGSFLAASRLFHDLCLILLVRHSALPIVSSIQEWEWIIHNTCRLIGLNLPSCSPKPLFTLADCNSHSHD